MQGVKISIVEGRCTTAKLPQHIFNNRLVFSVRLGAAVQENISSSRSSPPLSMATVACALTLGLAW